MALPSLALIGLMGCGEDWDDWLVGDPIPEVDLTDDGRDFRDRREEGQDRPLIEQIRFRQVVADDDSGIVTHAIRPRAVPVTAERLRSLRMPDGFSIEVFARDAGTPRMLAVHEGVLYVTQPARGEVWALYDDDRDGREDSRARVAAGLPGVHGIVFHEDEVFLAAPTAVWVAAVKDGRFSSPQPFVKDLPDGGQHPNRTLGVSPAGDLFISVGSTCNACDERNPEHATLLRVGMKTGKRVIFASGLRNTIGFGWHPATGELWGMDHGSDHRGDNQPPEELNLIVEGGHYGWPYVFGENETDPLLGEPPDMSLDEWRKRSIPPVLTYQAHAAPIEMEFYENGTFPDEYEGDAFVAMHGSWNRDPPVGYEVVRIDFDRGKAVAIKPFLSGFLISEDGEWAQFGRPTGLALDKGALFISDDSGGVIFRVTYDERGGF